jgi:hypothetical protein
VKRNAGRVVDGMRINEETSYKSNVTVWKLELLVGAKPDV